MILEIQQRILHFLVDCSQTLLHELTPVMLLETPIKPEPPSLADTSEYLLLSSVAAEAPYRLPAQVDFLRLRAIVDAQYSSAEDHVHRLREDPGYYAEAVTDWSEHRQEALLDTNGMKHPILNKPLFWDRVIGELISHVYGSLVLWGHISRQLKIVSILQAKYSDEILPDKKLPEEYLKALLMLQHILEQTKNNSIANLKHGLCASPPLRANFVRQPQEAGTTIIKVQSKQGGVPYLMWLFFSLWEEHQLLLLGLPGVVDEIEKVTQTPSEKSSLSS